MPSTFQSPLQGTTSRSGGNRTQLFNIRSYRPIKWPSTEIHVRHLPRCARPSIHVPRCARPQSTCLDAHDPQSTCLGAHDPQSTCLDAHDPQSMCLHAHDPQSTCLGAHDPQSTCPLKSMIQGLFPVPSNVARNLIPGGGSIL